MGGEQFCLICLTKKSPGSSPHGRGTDLAELNEAYPERFIPAWAGNSIIHSSGVVVLPVHPRMGGEQIKSSS